MLTWWRARAHKRDLQLADSLTSEANRLTADGQWAQVEPVLREVIRLRTAQMGAGAQPTLLARGGLGFTLLELRRYEEAAAELRDALPHFRAVWGQEHGNVDEVRLGLVRALIAIHSYAEVEELTHAVPAASRAMDDVRLLTWRFRATALSGLGRYREAVDEQTALLAAASLVFGEDHRALLTVRSNRLQQLAVLGETDLVEREYQALLAALDDRDLLRERVTSAQVFALNNAGRHAEAETTVRAAPTHRDQTALRLGLARSLNGQGRHEEALQVLTEAEAAYQQTQHTALTPLLATVTAQTLLGLGRLNEAETRARQAVELTEARYTPIHHRTLEAATTLGNVLAAQHRHTEAREHLTRCATAWREHFGPHHPNAVTTETALAALSRP